MQPLYLGVILTWTLVTVFAGAQIFPSIWPANFHARWALITLIPILALLYMSVGKKSPSKETSHRLILVSLMMVAGGLLGLGSQMGFIPHFYHQIIVWPLAIILPWQTFQFFLKQSTLTSSQSD